MRTWACNFGTTRYSAFVVLYLRARTGRNPTQGKSESPKPPGSGWQGTQGTRREQVRGTSKAPSARSKSMILKRLRTRFGIPVALMAVLALALPAGASALAPGEIEEFKGASKPLGVTSGCDGENVWFTEQETAKIGRITTSGTITKHGTLSGPALGITCGPDNNIWFTETSTSKIGRLKPSEPEAPTEFSVGTLQPTYITEGPDGNLWFIAPGQDK